MFIFNYKLLKKLRNQKKLSIQELSNVVNIDRSLLSLFERGKKIPNYDEINAIADFFEVQSDELLLRERQEKDETSEIIQQLLNKYRFDLSNSEHVQKLNELVSKEKKRIKTIRNKHRNEI
ncbi:helix-turn-helix domain-containing protein [Paenibacillus sp. HWE-109]|uniref:helix-turn-helix domain-containing protein n=1 Tax=Paenibacillus sp. HWE-109 TaxID=1306526 RepID=UPI001EDCB42D|nr:helix-turn-helix transcriptional regulator [Paenibacillus sp. HWE-109]UKS28422.1 helix-turn-helix domain-containing protein [Paenibacillus sp. HWE-109]